MEFTKQQQLALDYCLPRILANQDVALTGYAGTGKTTVSTELIKLLPSSWNVTYCAYTNKAAQVIERMLAYKGLSVQCSVSTIHSLLKLNKQHVDKETGKRTFKKNYKLHDEELKDYTRELLVIDEMGTVPNNEDAPLAYELIQLLETKLFMGDPCQLPPVGEEFGMLFELMEDDTVQLTEVVRYGGAILDAATRVRSAIKDYDAISDLDNDNDGSEGVFKLPNRVLKQKLIKYVKEDEFSVNKDFCKVITWTNEAMNYWNSLIRGIIYGSLADTQRFIVGSRIVCLESATKKEDYSSPHSRGQRVVKLMSASEEGVIENVHVGVCDLSGYSEYEIKTYYLDVLTEYGRHVTLHVIHEDDEKRLIGILKDFQKRKNWRCYWELKDFFHNVNDAYSLTIQRMQGSTCRYVVLDTDNFNQARNIWHRNRMYYTGLTRAEKAVYL